MTATSPPPGAGHGSYRGLLGPPTTAWQVALGAAGVLVASVPAVVFSGELIGALYGPDAIPPMFAVVDLPPWASVVSVLVVPLLAELAEPVAYLGVVLPRLEQRLGRPWPWAWPDERAPVSTSSAQPPAARAASTGSCIAWTCSR